MRCRQLCRLRLQHYLVAFEFGVLNPMTTVSALFDFGRISDYGLAISSAVKVTVLVQSLELQCLPEVCSHRIHETKIRHIRFR